MKLPAPAKLNLFLHVLGRRDDGYHQLQTVFQLLDYGDELQFETAGQTHITLDCPSLDMAPQDNLVYRAAQALQAHCGQATPGVHITLHKRLPAGGGVGGGSSDAATTLVGLNHLWKLGLSTTELAAIGLQLGADVPVFVHGYSAWGEGVGEQLRAVELVQRWYLVIAPGCAVSTAEVFSQRELTRNTSPIKMAAFFEAGGRNDCEPVVRQLYPEVDKALNWLNNFAQPRLTGTGSCIFAPFESESAARSVHAQLPPPWHGFVARGVNRSPLLAAFD